MRKYFFLQLILIFSFSKTEGQLILDANGPGSTYSLITSKLAPGYDPIEAPDCSHAAFGNHIDEVYDNDLGANVFRFYIHDGEDDDRCINVDRQRNEIKTYNQSPDSLLGVEGEYFEYKWKFKLPAGFQPSPKFTHIHQLKSVGGPESGQPLITLTCRYKASGDKLELRYAETLTQVTLTQVDLDPFKGEWVEVSENVNYGESGTYSITITKVSDGSVLLSYSDADIRMWKTSADFIRPKWGIYRSLLEPSYLRDEELLFANFSIQEFASPPLPVELVFFKGELIDDGAKLSWQTASEQNNLGFEIQRSIDGTNWEFVDFVAGQGNSSEVNNYAYKDEKVHSGIVYYRLKQIDKDDSHSFTNVVTVTRPLQDEIEVFPNPTNGLVKIQSERTVESIEVFDMKGNKKLQTFTNESQLDLSSLEKGIYFLKINTGGKPIVKRIISTSSTNSSHRICFFNHWLNII